MLSPRPFKLIKTSAEFVKKLLKRDAAGRMGASRSLGWWRDFFNAQFAALQQLEHAQLSLVRKASELHIGSRFDGPGA
jgi:hypothetical protein